MNLESLVQSTKRAARNAVILGSLALGAAGAYAQEARIVPVVGKGGGMNGSLWKSELVVVNPSQTEAARGKIVFFDHTQGYEDSNPFVAYSIPARGSQAFPDIIGAAGLAGNYALKIIPDAATSTVEATARIWNEQDLDANAGRTHLSQYMSAIKASELLAPGDVAEFVLPDSTPQADGRPAFRFNAHLYGESDGEGVEALVELYNTNGNLVNTRSIWVADHARGQLGDLVPSLFGTQQQPYDVIRITQKKGRLAIIGTPVQNNSDKIGLDDGGALYPSVERLVETAQYEAVPATVEAGDMSVLHLKIKSRPGTKVDGCSVYGPVGTNAPGNGTNELTWDYIGEPTAPGEYPLSATCGISTLDGGFLGARTIPGNTLKVNAARDDTPADSYNTTKNNIDALAHIIGDNFNTIYRGDNKHYTEAEMKAGIQLYTNGASTATDPELDHVEIKKSVNSFIFALKGGTNAVFSGFTPQQITALRTLYNVQ